MGPWLEQCLANIGRPISVCWINELAHWLITSSNYLYAHSPDGVSREGGSQRLECIIRTTKKHVIGSEQTSVSFRMPAIDSTFSRSRWSGSLLMEPGRQVCFGACAPMVPIQLYQRPSAGMGIITPVGCSWHYCGHFPLGFFAFNWGLYFAPWKLRAPILPSGLFVFSLLVDEATVLSKVKRLNCSFWSREVLNHGFLCSRRVGQREEGTGTDPERRGPPGSPRPLAHHCAGKHSF